MIIASRCLPAAAALAIAFVTSAPARAQSDDAETLFRDGKRLMKEGKIAEACAKLDASEHLEPRVGTRLNLADCRERNGQLATARAIFLDAAAAANHAGDDAEREAEARRRAAALEPRIAHLTISVAVASRIDGLVIERDGQPVDPALWNQGVPSDPGEYEISGQAPGHRRWSTTVRIAAEAQQVNVEVPRLEPVEARPPAVTTATTTSLDKPAPAERARAVDEPVDENEQPGTFTGTRKVAVATSVAGVTGIAVGALFGSRANELGRQADAICPGTVCASAPAVQLNHDARRDATIADLAFVGGGVALAGAATLWFLGAPKLHGHPIEVTPIVTSGEVGFAIAEPF